MNKPQVGYKVKFKTEKQRYKIMACNERYLVCMKPFNARKTYLYCIVDLKEKLRGPDNWYCKFDYETNEGAQEALNELISGVIQISHRRRMKLDLERIDVR